jgi:DNA-binding GntR family transcriptional regulator
MKRVIHEKPVRKWRNGDDLPEYITVKQYFLNGIKKGRFPSHKKLPSERELSNQFSVNRNTVRHALNMLEKEGYIYRSIRRGWFVKGHRLVYNPAQHLNFVNLAVQQGMEPSWNIFESQRIVATNADAQLFEAKKGIPLYLARETASVDGWLVYYAEILFNAGLCPDILPKIKKKPITDVLEKDYKFKVRQKELLIRPIRLQSRIQNFLNVPTGTPGLFIRRIKCNDDGSIIEIDNEYWRYDAIEVRVK